MGADPRENGTTRLAAAARLAAAGTASACNRACRLAAAGTAARSGWARSSISGPLTIVLLLFAASPALAHKMNVFASVEGKTIQGKVYFRGQAPAQNVTVSALDPAGEELGRTTSDAEGKFRLEAHFRCDHRLVVETDDGHGADYTVAADQLPDDLPLRAQPATGAPVSAAASTAGPVSSDAAATPAGSRQLEAIRAEIARLEEQLRAYEDRLRLQDILGAIGYIVGITGIAYYYLGVRRKRASTAGSSRSP